ncbi:DUF805 domain-containing protein [Acinetobacter equi]|uniref:DUF805 domain-containing protein n=1 Tax=Acinetobacter equi TaxID=1324350 RepID=UPI0009D70F25|nr:DUF805 domain-containing protein [Acinetobacter equi]
MTTSNSSLKYNLFSPQGRISRATYIAWSLIAAIISLIILLILSSAFLSADISSLDLQNSEEISTFLNSVSFIQLPIYIIGYYFLIIFTIKRLHDLNLTGWLSLLLFIPLINFFFGLYLFFAKGNISSNKFGEPRVALSWETAVAWIYIIIMCLVGLIMVSALMQLATLL